jgi:hypothetical protein
VFLRELADCAPQEVRPSSPGHEHSHPIHNAGSVAVLLMTGPSLPRLGVLGLAPSDHDPAVDSSRATLD